jgi:hypothetical protein
LGDRCLAAAQPDNQRTNQLWSDYLGSHCEKRHTRRTDILGGPAGFAWPKRTISTGLCLSYETLDLPKIVPITSFFSVSSLRTPILARGKEKTKNICWVRLCSMQPQPGRTIFYKEIHTLRLHKTAFTETGIDGTF